MARWSRLGIGIALLFSPALSTAQSSAIRVKHDAAILEQPREDGRVLVTVPPGMVLVILELQSDWYRVTVPWPETTRGRPATTGWINRASVEPLRDLLQPPPARTQPAGPPDAPVSAPQPSVPSPLPRQRTIGRGTTELILDGGFTGVQAGGTTISTVRLDTAVGYFLTEELEAAVLTNVQKVTNIDPNSGLGGGLLYNVGINRPANAFVGGAVGRTFGMSPLNATTVTVFGGIRAMVPSRGGAFFVRPFWQRDYFSGGLETNEYGVALGVSIFF